MGICMSDSIVQGCNTYAFDGPTAASSFLQVVNTECSEEHDMVFLPTASVLVKG